MKKPHLYLVDGSGFIFRAFHALPPLTRSDGVQVNAVYGFCTMLAKILTDHKADYLAVVYDSARRNFRNDIYKEYKAHRPAPPPELIPQFKLIREATSAFNVPWVELEGYEADDLIATYAKKAAEKGYKVTVISSDKDIMQIVTEDVELFDYFKNLRIGPSEVEEKYGVPPSKMIDIQALMGDSSDNVPGVPKIGPKTAGELIREFGSFDNLLRSLDKIPQKGRRENLQEHQEQAKLSYQLVQLKNDVEVPKKIEEFAFSMPKPDQLIPFLKEQEFKTLVSRFEKQWSIDEENSENKEEKHYTTIHDLDDLRKWVDKAYEKGFIAINIESTTTNPIQTELVGISLSLSKKEACYIPLDHIGPFDDRLENQIDFEKGLKLLKPLLEDPSVLKIGHNIKADSHCLKRYDINLTPIEDVMILSYVLDNGRHGHHLDALAQLFFDYETTKYKALVGTGKKQLVFNKVPLKDATHYASEEADIIYRLHHQLKPRLLEEHMVYLYDSIERPLIPVLTAMEERGIILDLEALKKTGDFFAERAKGLEEKIYEEAGEKFTIGSPKQLGEILFEKLKLPAPKKGKSGSYETHADILEPLAVEGHKIAEHILAWRQMTKLISTYVEGLKTEVNPKTGRVHTTFGMTNTSTGRLNSANPNLQNIPIRTEEGREIRRAFKAEKGYRLVSFDYSQIELRLLAEMADVEELKEAFRQKKDIHRLTASQMFNVPLEKVDSDLRHKAKAINFGIVYGMSGFGLAKQIGTSRTEANEYIKAYFEHYPDIKNYVEKTKEFCREHGYVKTYLGRKCYIPDINNKNAALRSFAERAAINAPLQGSNADIIKLAMIKIHHLLKEEYPKAHMLLQVHDELIFEIPEDDLEKLNPIIKKEMEKAVLLSLPIAVDIGIGANWAEAGE